MAPYLLLFEIAVRHAFYAPAPCAGLRLTPAPASARQLRRIGAVLRPTAEGLAVYADSLRLATLHALAQDPAAPLEFYLLGRSQDRDFPSATAGLASAEGQVLLLDSAGAQAPGADGWRLLHPGPHAGTESVVSTRLPPLGDTPATDHTPKLEGALPPAERRVPPAFVLRIRIDAPATGEVAAPPQAGAADADTGAAQAWAAQALGRRWCAALQARATRWKYLLPADWAEQTPQVVDIDKLIGFDPPQAEALADGRSALTTRSRSDIALHRRPRQRFQLLAQTPAADKVLVKRLPVASAGQLHMETIDGVRTLVSEIFVNR
jgi:hypothetical protein